jgi:hypothetical protein
VNDPSVIEDRMIGAWALVLYMWNASAEDFAKDALASSADEDWKAMKAVEFKARPLSIVASLSHDHLKLLLEAAVNRYSAEARKALGL